MRSILIAGFPGHFATWLADRLPGISVQIAFSADEAELAAGKGNSLLLIDLALGADETVLALRKLRQRSGAPLPVVVTTELGVEGVDEALLDRLVHGLRVDRLLFHPLDRAELLRAVTGLLGARQAAAEPAPAPVPEVTVRPAWSPPPPTPPAAERISSALDALWPRAQATMFERVGVLEQAARAAAAGQLADALRQQATQEAHRLAGALGTFGLPEGTRIARELETRYGSDAHLTPADGARLAVATVSLRAEVERRPASTAAEAAPPAPAVSADVAAAPAPAPAEVSDAAATVLVLTSDGAVSQAVHEALAGGPARVVVAADPESVDAAARRPLAVVLDVSAGDAEWRALSGVAERFPGVAVIVATERGELPDRLRAVQLGAHGFLQKPLTPESVRDAVAAVLPAPGRRRSRILCVDDDPHLLEAVRAVLEPRGVEVHTLNDPLRFWTRLGEVEPDLLVLDIEMPHVNGIELCRVVRADPRWRSLPVVFLTARTEAETLYRVFAAGADDFVGKPFVGPELIARIHNRLERVQG